ncbi:RluA family pseudouridine synthase [Marinoscillum furvescens]|uniref:RluA family pseudouridine synthase n=1 Tax=Marinoscillum furvescens DSM 4134 TaxID=1122208 RepID=A0A3D9L1G1_MARFU|nr:RluA family pseudouridine synthase [Marinoscillum furvescens]RED96670.1 RluA family pseudouridine synthase [Marinoscillum furvescens DSM 4134]
MSDYAIGIFEELPTKNTVKKAIKNGQIRVNEQQATTGIYVEEGMVISLFEPPISLTPYPLEIEKVYEDDHLVVVSKPAGLPTNGNYYRTLEAALAHEYVLPKIAGALLSPRTVHRLDSPTTGLVIAAKTAKSRFLLGQQFEKGSIQKTYHALVMGETPASGVITTPIAGKEAMSTFQKVSAVRSPMNDYLTLLRLQPKTGRTHQLRIHCAASGFPIYGDQEYAEHTIQNKGLFLAATAIAFEHPITGANLEVTIALPAKFENRMKNEDKRWKRHRR